MSDSNSETSKNQQKINGEWTQRSSIEQVARKNHFQITKGLLSSYHNNWDSFTMLTLSRLKVSRILYWAKLYQEILYVPGVICEFGARYGETLSQLASLRGIFEPYNHTRKLIGFDTFEGFPSVDAKDGGHSLVGDYSSGRVNLDTLEAILLAHEKLSPLAHIKKFELVKGDVSKTINPWLNSNPHVIISMAIFDMDLYKPTKDALTAIVPRLTRGSLLVFDELNHEKFPGETRAVAEVLGLNKLQLRRDPNQSYCAYAVFE